MPFGICPKCFKKGMLTKHHIFPKKKHKADGDILHLCSDCHRDIEDIIRVDRKLEKTELVDIHKAWLNNKNPIVR